MSDFQPHQDGGGLRSHADLYFAILGVKNTLPSYTVLAQNSTTMVCIHINARKHTYVIDRYKTNKQKTTERNQQTKKKTTEKKQRNKRAKERKQTRKRR